MIDIKLIREVPDKVKQNIRKKFQNNKLPLVDDVKKLDEQWRKIKVQVDSLRHDRNKVSQEINQIKKQGKPVTHLIKQAREIPDKISKLEEESKKLQAEIKQLMLNIPNIIHSSVPIGKDESENVERKKIGKPRKFSFKIKNHAKLAEELGGVDFDTAAKISGTGFYILKRELALLDNALINFSRDFMLKKGFEYVLPPLMIRKKVVDGVMSFEEMNNMMYKIDGEDLYMIGTSEHPLIGMFIEKTINKNELPVKITGFSPCFRKEIGSHGIDEKGLFRVRQFNKQEVIVICEPEDSYKWYDKMLEFSIDLFKELGLPIRVLEICSGDLADLKAKSCDVEAWSPRKNRYFELGSLTNMEEAQARRLGIKIQGKDGRRYYAHTLNNTVLATSRAIVAILENNQQKDGSVKIPKALWKYTHFKEIQPQKKKEKVKERLKKVKHRKEKPKVKKKIAKKIKKAKAKPKSKVKKKIAKKIKKAKAKPKTKKKIKKVKHKAKPKPVKKKIEKKIKKVKHKAKPKPVQKVKEEKRPTKKPEGEKARKGSLSIDTAFGNLKS